MNLNIDLNLLKLEKACILSVQGKFETKKGVFIPIEDNDIYVSVEGDKPKAAYLSVTAWESREEKFGQTHYVKQSFSKQFRESVGEETIKNKPIIGNGKAIVVKEVNTDFKAPEIEADPFTDNLPF